MTIWKPPDEEEGEKGKTESRDDEIEDKRKLKKRRLELNQWIDRIERKNENTTPKYHY